jgi:hypothetical protein
MPSANSDSKARSRCLKPIVYSGSLDSYTQRDLTPVIGREYEGLQVRDLLASDEQLIKDLAITSKYQPFQLRVILLTTTSLTARSRVSKKSRCHSPGDAVTL